MVACPAPKPKPEKTCPFNKGLCVDSCKLKSDYGECVLERIEFKLSQIATKGE